MDLKLAGKVALVTGSSRGIGEAIAIALAGEGAIVFVHGRHAALAQRVQRRIEEAGGRAHVVVGDISSEEGITQIASQVASVSDRIDILINNAGGSSSRQETWDSTELDTWKATLGSNVLPAVRLSRLVLPQMRANGWGRIVNLSSGAALMPPAGNPDYSAAKAAVLAMTASMAKAVARDGVTVNAISPGAIHSDKLDARFRQIAAERGCSPDAPWEEIEKQVLPLMGSVPVGRVGTLDELADVALFLCSPLASYITGMNVRVDGGMFPGI